MFVSLSIWLNRFLVWYLLSHDFFLGGCASLQVPLAWRLLLSPFPLAVATEVKPFCCRGRKGGFPHCTVPLVSPGKNKGGGVHILLLGYKECTWKKIHKFTGAQIYFAINQIQDLQCPVVKAHLKAFFSWYLISDRTTFHCWIKETTWEMLAKGLLESNFKAFEKPSIFSNNSTLSFSSPCCLDIRQTDRQTCFWYISNSVWHFILQGLWISPYYTRMVTTINIYLQKDMY